MDKDSRIMRPIRTPKRRHYWSGNEEREGKRRIRGRQIHSLGSHAEHDGQRNRFCVLVQCVRSCHQQAHLLSIYVCVCREKRKRDTRCVLVRPQKMRDQADHLFVSDGLFPCLGLACVCVNGRVSQSVYVCMSR